MKKKCNCAVGIWIDEWGDPDNIEKCVHVVNKNNIFTLQSYFEKIKKFQYCPRCGKKIDWKAILDIIRECPEKLLDNYKF